MIKTEYTINDQILERTDDTTIIAQSKNIVKTLFHFNGTIWDNIDKFAIFTDSWGNKTTIHLGKAETCSCIIPNGCLNGTFFKLTVYGGDLITTNDVTIPLMSSGYTKHHHHTNNCGHDEKDIFVDIFTRLDNTIDNIVVVDKCLQCYSNDKLVDSVCLNSFVDEAQLDELIQSIVTKTEIKAFLEEEGYIKNLDFNFETGELIFEK